MKSHHFKSASFLIILCFSALLHLNKSLVNSKNHLKTQKSHSLKENKNVFNKVNKFISTEYESYSRINNNIYIILLSTTIATGFIFLVMLIIYTFTFYQEKSLDKNMDCDNTHDEINKSSNIDKINENNDCIKDTNINKCNSTNKTKSDFKLKFLKLYKERKNNEKNLQVNEPGMINSSDIIQNKDMFNNLSFNKKLNMSSIEESIDEANSSVILK